MKKHVFSVIFGVVVGMAALAHGLDNSGNYSTQDYALQDGTVRIFSFGDVKLHAYQTNDAMADECFVLETNKNLVAIESPSFHNNTVEWKRYLDGLGKPLTDILLSYHPTGGKWYGKATSYATQTAKDAITDGPTRKLVDNLKLGFGAGFSTDIPAVDKVIREGANTIGGIEFIVTDDGDGYDIAIPAANAVYVHMLGANVHSILVSPGHIDATIAKLESFKIKGYDLILSSHHIPETMADVNAKLAYLREVKNLASRSAGKEAFIKNLKAEYPAYAGENYLDMTANALYADGK